MDVNLLPEGAKPHESMKPTIGVSLEGVRRSLLEEQLTLLRAAGFGAAEIDATGEPWALYAPGVEPEARAALRNALGEGQYLALLAPTQATFDVTLVSPSAAIRRASVTELWSVCRLAGSLVFGEGTSAVVVIRTGIAPVATPPDREAAHLSECLTTLDRMAGEQKVRVALRNADYFSDPFRFAALRSLGLRHTGAALDVGAALDRGITGKALADFARSSADLLLHVRVPDTIVADVEPLAGALQETGYRHLVCLVPDEATPNSARLEEARLWWANALGIGG